MIRLDEIPIVVIDVQTTGAGPSSGRILELAFSRGKQTVSHVVRGDQPVHPRYLQLTGLTQEEIAAGIEEEAMLAAMEAALSAPVVAVAHYARFEKSFLTDLWQRRRGIDPPFPWLCTHAIGKRLFSGLPSSSLRALAGHLGLSLDLLKRAGPHVDATLMVWNELCTKLEHEHGVTTLAALEAWLAKPAAKPTARRYLVDRAKRLALPAVPGIYRMVASQGRTLYIGKATSLRDRVNSYFRQQRSHSAAKRELLAQVADIIVTPCPTALEAALLESDEIKRYDPPYNTALKTGKRQIRFLGRDFKEEGDAWHGPFGSLEPFRWLEAVAESLNGDTTQPLARLFHEEVEAEILKEGLALFRQACGGQTWTIRSLLALGLVTLRREAAEATDEDELDEESDDEPDDLPALDENLPMTAPEVGERLWDLLRETARYHLRAKIIRRAASGRVAWKPAGSLAWRQLTLMQGAVVACEEVDQPPMDETEKPQRSNDFAWDVATYDRVRVLVTELHREAALSASDPAIDSSH